MLNRHLTPLGRQLRTVLANLCPATTARPSNHCGLRGHQFHEHAPARRTIDCRLSDSAAEGTVLHDGSQSETQNRASKENIDDATHASGSASILTPDTPLSRDHELPSPLSRFPWMYEGPSRITIRGIVHKCLQARTMVEEGKVDGIRVQDSWRPTLRDRRYLRMVGVTMDNIGDWADIIAAEDAVTASRLLSRQVAGLALPPLFIALHTLQRDDIGPLTLRMICDFMPTYFPLRGNGRRRRRRPHPNVGRLPVFRITKSLLEHALRVQPQALSGIAEAMVNHMAEFPLVPATQKRLSSLTRVLNGFLRLLSTPTALNPFKNTVYREAAMVHVLTYMAEHVPVLQIDREGHRAIVQLQLAQRKTPGEQQWAELKALSWPPWKVDRTAMDASIDVSHGVSKAGFTLQSMQEAGYAPQRWEQIAKISSGWELDGTPTIQTRALGPQSLKRSSLWVARLRATRTIQEAWACYLSFQDINLPHDQMVYLAMFEKLFAEEKRSFSESQDKPAAEHGEPAWRLFPGDQKTIEPLPPSTHLYTYTRTQPPSVDAFYNGLRQQGVVFQDACLALLVSNASSLAHGVQYLKDSKSIYPAIGDLFIHSPTENLRLLPGTVLCAAVELFSRHQNSQKGTRPFVASVPSKKLKTLLPLLPGYTLNRTNLIVHVLLLVRAGRSKHPRAWNLALRGLTRVTGFLGDPLSFGSLTRGVFSDESQNVQTWSTTFVAYQLVLRAGELMRDYRIGLDSETFHIRCLAAERMAIASWDFLRAHDTSRDNVLVHSPGRRQWLKDEVERFQEHGRKRLKRDFEELVGERDDESTTRSKSAVHLHPYVKKARQPSLLTVPHPAVLHAFVRAMGWTADYEGILALANFITRHREQVQEQARLHRRGDSMMRLLATAMRVFLERSWLPASSTDTDGDHAGQSMSAKDVDGAWHLEVVKRLRTPASAEVITAVRELVEQWPDWGQWPTSEAVDEYCAHESFSSINVSDADGWDGTV